MGLLATAHQPVFMPWLGLIHKIAVSDVFISWDDVQQEDSGFENRNQILTAKGPQWLTVPCLRGRDLKVREVKIAGGAWRRKQLRTLELAYSKAPLWKRHEEFLRFFYGQEWERLEQANDSMRDYMLGYFGLLKGGTRFFKLSGLNAPGDKGARILAACRAIGANQYLFGAHGVDYANKAEFLAHGVEPFVQEYECQRYPQIGAKEGDFTSRLSALDLMMNVEQAEALRVMMAGGSTRRMG